MQELVDACERAIKEIKDSEAKKQDELLPICRVPLITSPNEEQLLIQSTTKVCAEIVNITLDDP